MAKFGAELTNSPEIRDYTPQQEGVATGQAGKGDVFDILSAGTRAVAGYATDYLADDLQKKTDAYLSDFQQKQLALVDAVDQGAMTHAAARSEFRKNLAEATTANQHLSEDLLSINRAIAGSGGLGQVLNEKDFSEQATEEAVKYAIDRGYALPADNATAAEVTIFTERMRRMASRDTAYEERIKQLDLQIKEGNLSDDEYRRLERNIKDVSENYLVEAAPDRYEDMKLEVENILKEYDPAQAELELTNLLAEIRMQSTQWGSANVDSSFMTTWMKPFEEYINKAMGVANGSLESDALKNHKNVLVQKDVVRVLTENPELRSLAALYETFPELVALVGSPYMNKLAPHLQEIFMKVQNPAASGGGLTETGEVDTPESSTVGSAFNREQLKAMGPLVNSVIELAENGEGSVQAEAIEVAKSLATTLAEKVGDNENYYSRDPRAAGALVNVLAEPNFVKLTPHIQNSPEIQDDMNETFKRVVNTQIYPMAVGEFEKNNIVYVNEEAMFGNNDSSRAGMGAMQLTRREDTVEKAPAGKFITYEWVDGRGVVFKQIEGVETKGTQQESIQFALDRLNGKGGLGRALTTVAKASAHLDGHQDYGSSFSLLMQGLQEQRGGDVLIPTDQQPELMEPSDLSIIRGLKSTMPTFVAGIKATEQSKTGNPYDSTIGDFHLKHPMVKPVSQMTFKEVKQLQNSPQFREWGRQFTKGKYAGQVSTALGRYQIVGTTFEKIQEAMGLSDDTIFDEDTQDAMAMYLFAGRVNNKKSQAAKRAGLRQEWEGFKKLSDEELDQMIAEFEKSGIRHDL